MKLLRQKINKLLLLIIALIPNIAWPLNSDSNQPANFTSDQVIYNYKQGITIFIGHVKMVQGTTILMADKVHSYANSEGKIYQVVATGNLAHYTTLPDNQDQVLDVLGKKITYYPLEKKAVVYGNGIITQGPNQFTGTHLAYDMQAQLVTSFPVEGNQSVIVLEPQNMPGENRSNSPAKNNPPAQKPKSP